MRVIDPGHVYDLNWVDGDPLVEAASPGYDMPPNRLIFVKRTGPKYPGNDSAWPGTQIQEVCRALIDRLQYVDKQEPHRANISAIWHLREIIHQLELRAAVRHGRRIPSPLYETCIELVPTCSTCGHIGCENTCRPQAS